MSIAKLARQYEWINKIEGCTIAVIANRSITEVMEAYCGEPTKPLGNLTFFELEKIKHREYDSVPGSHFPFYVQLLNLGDHVIAFEENGWNGSEHSIAKSLSANGGHLFSVYQDINAYGYLTEARDGQITASFESLYPLVPEAENDEIRPPWALGPEIDREESSMQTCCALMEQQTGIRVPQELLTARLPTYRITEFNGIYQVHHQHWGHSVR